MKVKKVSRLFWVHYDPKLIPHGTQEWTKIEGEKVVFDGFEDYDFFIHKDYYGFTYKISEGSSGHALPRVNEETKADAIKKAIVVLLTKKNIPITLESAHERLNRMTGQMIEQFGMSPRYKEIMEVVK